MDVPSTARSNSAKPPSIYNRVFWLSYLANLALVTANALTFRFAELVAFFGGTEQLAGSIVAAGLFAALITRLFLGQAIDRYGTARLWVLSSLLFIVGCLTFLFCEQISWVLYAARTAFAVGIAGMFTCSIVHVQKHVPAHRRTEVIGNLGSSGFLGMILGSQSGDLIFNMLPAGKSQFVVLFAVAAVLGLVYVALVVILTRGDTHHRPTKTPPVHRLILRYWPGPVVLVAIMMGLSFSVTTVFLTRFATERGLGGIGIFFTAYSVSAFVVRMSVRFWIARIGPHRMIVIGLIGHCIGMAQFPSVTTSWHFLMPALACGFAHALLFPAVISIGSGAFPKHYRGTGTTIVLGFTEVGVVLSAPTLGAIIDRFGFVSMFFATSTIAALAAVFYAVASARHTSRAEKNRVVAHEEAPLTIVDLPILVESSSDSNNSNPIQSRQHLATGLSKNS